MRIALVCLLISLNSYGHHKPKHKIKLTKFTPKGSNSTGIADKPSFRYEEKWHTGNPIRARYLSGNRDSHYNNISITLYTWTF